MGAHRHSHVPPMFRPVSQFGSCYHAAAIRQRRPSFHAARNVREVATVSARALLVLLARGVGGFFRSAAMGAIMSFRAGAPGLMRPHWPRTP